MCFGKTALQFHPNEQDPTKYAISNSLGVRRVASAIKSATSLLEVEEIVKGFTRDSQDMLLDAVFVHEYTNGERCGEDGQRRRATVGYFCNPSMTLSAFRMKVTEPYPCFYVIEISTARVC